MIFVFTGDLIQGTRIFQNLVHGDLYKPDNQLFHIDGSFNLGDTNYNGKVHLEKNKDLTRIELRRAIKLGKGSSPNGYDFVYERKNNLGTAQNTYTIASHLALRTPVREEPIKVLNFQTTFARTTDLSNASLQSALDFIILTRTPPTPERIELDYARQSVRTNSQSKRLISPEAHLKIQVKTKSNVFNFLIDHRHRKSAEASKKGFQIITFSFHL